MPITNGLEASEFEQEFQKSYLIPTVIKGQAINKNRLDTLAVYYISCVRPSARAHFERSNCCNYSTLIAFYYRMLTV